MIYLDACKFTTLAGETSFGFKIYDEHVQTYDNLSEIMIEDDLDLLEYALQSNDIVKDILKTVKENKESITINGQIYSWKEISVCFS
jgi:hypothetical protein